MKISNMVRFATFSMFLASGSLALADTPPAQNHHCKLPDGSMDMKKTHKQCDTAKGEWALDAPKPTTTAKDATAPKDTTKPTTPAKDATKPTTPPPAPSTPPVKAPAPTPAPATH